MASEFLHVFYIKKVSKVIGQNGKGLVSICCRKLNNKKGNKTVTIFTEL